jgi:hypothetical protein
MLIKNQTEYKLKGTKAETLDVLSKIGYNVPKVYFFTVEEWSENIGLIVNTILSSFNNELLAVRSSTKAEDSQDSSMAGAFHSVLNVKSNSDSIKKSIEEVINSFDGEMSNQVLVQPMVTNVAISGVIMTQVLDDGSPYHVINYDDETGKTDTVTSGTTINKTVYIYNGVSEKDFDSSYLLAVLSLIRSLQNTFPNIPLDIEFAVDKNENIHLLQVRRITTIKNWKTEVNDQVSTRMIFLKNYVEQLMHPRPGLFGKKTLLGFMPDWNPAEMIGVVPHPLAMSLYREIITNNAWRTARENMGYRKMPNVELMVSLFGRVYIDVRNSFNSFLPEGLNNEISEKLVNAYLERLNKTPHFHDKIEFEVIHTAYDFDFDKNFNERYPSLLTDEELAEYKSRLISLTKEAISKDEKSGLKIAYEKIEHLKTIQNTDRTLNRVSSFSIADRINTLKNECIDFGTIPFSVLARHGFIAEGLLRSAVNNSVISEDRLKEFKRSIITVAGDMSHDFYKVLNSEISKVEFLKKYGHLRPSSYDILSPNYSNREDLFNGESRELNEDIQLFELTNEEENDFNKLLKDHGFEEFTASDILDYSKNAIVGREYAKFVFTKHLSSILELVAEWGSLEGFDREELAMLTINDVLNILFSPLTDELKVFYQKKINKARNNYEIASSFKLSYLIRSVRDVHIVPMQRSFPNFVGNQRIEGEVIELTPHIKEIPDLNNKIVCIEGADPGYDWIFTRNILGLITKYGGSNSHMAIRSAEYGIPAAIGCGEQPYNRIIKAKKCLLDCQAKRLTPISLY